MQEIVIQLQFQLQLQWKDFQNIVTNSLTHEPFNFADVNTVDLFCISIPNLLKPHFSVILFFHQSLFNFNFLQYIISFVGNCQVCCWIHIASSSIMVLAKPWYHVSIIYTKENKF